jgi:VanZ family protein
LSRIAKYHLPFWFYIILIFVLSSIPGDKLPDEAFKISDKLIHFFLYFILYFLTYLFFVNQDKSGLLKKYSLIFALIFCIIYGASDEFHQYFVPRRSCDVYDFLFDSLGGIAGMVLVFIFFIKRKNNLLYIK